jgi:hypothetical protein
MYGGGTQAAPGDPRISPPQPSKPTVGQTHQDTIEYLQLSVSMLDKLLAKVQGAHPEENQKAPEEMPSVLANAGKLRQLAISINHRLEELHQVIGD